MLVIISWVFFSHDPKSDLTTNLLFPSGSEPCMWLFLAGEEGFAGSSSLKDPAGQRQKLIMLSF